MTILLVCTGFLINSAIVVVVLDVIVCKSGKVFFGAVCNLVIPPLKSGPLEVNKPSIDQLLPWPQNRNGDFQSHPNIWSSEENVWQCVQIKHVKHSEFFQQSGSPIMATLQKKRTSILSKHLISQVCSFFFTWAFGWHQKQACELQPTRVR